MRKARKVALGLSYRGAEASFSAARWVKADWASMTPEQRSEEMMRRAEAGAKNRKKG